MENKDLPAYPQPLTSNNGSIAEIGDYNPYAVGLSKREWAAAIAMQALIGNWEASCKICDSDPRYDGENFKEVVAMNSVEFADALFTELSKAQP